MIATRSRVVPGLRQIFDNSAAWYRCPTEGSPSETYTHHPRLACLHFDAGRLPKRFMNATQYSSGSGTASGEMFRPDGLTAAHKKLPFGTRVKITNPRTGATTIVRINDRGPFTHGRDIDLSSKS
jgi:hypothetical protein